VLTAKTRQLEIVEVDMAKIRQQGTMGALQNRTNRLQAPSQSYEPEPQSEKGIICDLHAAIGSSVFVHPYAS
jgi:hypothetical protein